MTGSLRRLSISLSLSSLSSTSSCCGSAQKVLHSAIQSGGGSVTCFTPVALINLLSVLPAFIPLLIPFDLRALRLLRLFRIIRLLKLTKYSDSLKIIFRALDAKKEQFILTFIAVIVFVIITSIFVYYAETGENPSEAFADLPHTIWWGMETLSPVSAEDAVPITMTGKLIMTTYALLQIAIFAIPAGIMCSAFDEEWAKEHEDPDLRRSRGSVLKDAGILPAL